MATRSIRSICSCCFSLILQGRHTRWYVCIVPTTRGKFFGVSGLTCWQLSHCLVSFCGELGGLAGWLDGLIIGLAAG